MVSANVSLRYRPVRIGWCIRDNNWDDLRRAMRVTHILWGGKFNPIIPTDAQHAGELVRRFRVDVLLDISDNPQIKMFMQGFKYLPWPLLQPALLSNSFGHLVPNFLDVSHSLRRIADEVRVPDHLAQSALPVPAEHSHYAFVHWREDDPLKDVLLATFGGYPPPSEIGRDYEGFIRENIKPFHCWASQEKPLPPHLLDKLSPSEITTLDLNWDRVPYDMTLGFYAGRADDFEDLVNFWNLRACGLNLLFLDPAHSERLAALRQSHLEFIQQRRHSARHPGNEVAVWGRLQEVIQQLALPVAYYNAVEGTDAVQGNLRPPLHYLCERTVLASLSERDGNPTLAFQLPEKPFNLEDDEWEAREQHFVISLTSLPYEARSTNTFWTPYIPELNDWYGRNICLPGRTARSEIEGIGIIRPITDQSLEVGSIRKQELANKLFELAGIEAQPSLPGRVASRVISQLGGLQGCRVLKIAGVRRLIKTYGPLQDFDRTEAIRTIGNCDPETNQPRFSDYETLFIEERDYKGKLKPEHAFQYLLEKGVFRVGLTLVCPICELSFWVHLDDVSTHIACELCGSEFGVPRQLKDRAWAYRRSGLFGKQNNQEGSIPVALTLQQLEANLNCFFGMSLLLTNLSLTPAGANIQPCETDIFVALPKGDIIEVAVGECKDAGGKIELDDARKLGAVADAFPGNKFHSYIVFSKTAPFTPEEIENCKAAQRGLRIIMLSDRELEPYYAYEKTSQQFDVNRYSGSLEEMARVTHDVFLAPKPKSTRS